MPKRKGTKLRESARGQDCTLTIYPYCNGNPETTVLCHINCEHKGWGIKSPDFFSVLGCSDCHDIIDGRRKTDLPKEEILACILRGIYRTWLKFIEMGLIKVPA